MHHKHLRFVFVQKICFEICKLIICSTCPLNYDMKLQILKHMHELLHLHLHTYTSTYLLFHNILYKLYK